jgi:hypothetical protein
MSTRNKFIFAVLIVLLAAASRLLKHPFNFTPVAAMALFAGCYLRKSWGIIFPLAAMVISDYFLGFYEFKLMASVYISIGLVFFIGFYLHGKLKWYNVIFSSLASSISFFIITNFATWYFADWYPHTWAGLMNCFNLALPFFRNTLAGDLVYSGLFFGAYSAVLAWSEKRIMRKVSA